MLLFASTIYQSLLQGGGQKEREFAKFCLQLCNQEKMGRKQRTDKQAETGEVERNYRMSANPVS